MKTIDFQTIFIEKVLNDMNGYNSFRDILLEFGITDIDDASCKAIFSRLPQNITYEAIQWGIDTVVRDSIYTYLIENPDIYFSYIIGQLQARMKIQTVAGVLRILCSGYVHLSWQQKFLDEIGYKLIERKEDFVNGSYSVFQIADNFYKASYTTVLNEQFGNENFYPDNLDDVILVKPVIKTYTDYVPVK